jgi:hypothetical protein
MRRFGLAKPGRELLFEPHEAEFAMPTEIKFATLWPEKREAVHRERTGGMGRPKLRLQFRPSDFQFRSRALA